MVPVGLHRQLLQPEFYPEQPTKVEFRETHISRIYLLDHHVYKLKKPVNFGFLDFSTLEQRQFFCEEEVRLNRRFCPDTYLGVVPVCLTGQRLHLGPPGEPVEYLVRMQRLPEERMLPRLLARQAPELPTAMTALGHRLAQLHREAPICAQNEGRSDLEQVRRNWEENFRQIEPGIGQTLSREGFASLRRYVEGYLERNAGLFLQRERDGWVRECHGDLHADHVCLTEPVRIYDCIEFNRRFRVGDILADIAFLLMDLDHLRRPDLADRLWQAYRDGLDAPAPAGLLRFYQVYRACVRGKVAAFLARDTTVQVTAREAAQREALAYFSRALGYLSPPSLLLTCGLMGTGKSRLARELAPLLRAEVVRSDEIRLRFKTDPAAAAQAGFGQDAYSARITDEVYRLLAEQAQVKLESGHSVILDASFADAGRRQQLAQVARDCGVPPALLYCYCARSTAMARLRGRQRKGLDLSDGRSELYDQQAARFDRPTADEPAIWVDTSGPVDYTVNRVLGQLPEIIGESG